MCPQEFCWALRTTPLQTGQTNSSFSFNTNFSECWMEVSSDSQDCVRSGDMLDSSDLVLDSSDLILDSSGSASFILCVVTLQQAYKNGGGDNCTTGHWLKWCRVWISVHVLLVSNSHITWPNTQGSVGPANPVFSDLLSVNFNLFKKACFSYLYM